MRATVSGQATWVDLTGTQNCQACGYFSSESVALSRKAKGFGHCVKAKEVSNGRPTSQFNGSAQACTFFKGKGKS
jgi:hypothetical protein